MPVLRIDLLPGVLEGERNAHRHGPEGDQDEGDVGDLTGVRLQPAAGAVAREGADDGHDGEEDEVGDLQQLPGAALVDDPPGRHQHDRRRQGEHDGDLEPAGTDQEREDDPRRHADDGTLEESGDDTAGRGGRLGLHPSSVRVGGRSGHSSDPSDEFRGSGPSTPGERQPNRRSTIQGDPHAQDHRRPVHLPRRRRRRAPDLALPVLQRPDGRRCHGRHPVQRHLPVRPHDIRSLRRGMARARARRRRGCGAGQGLRRHAQGRRLEPRPRIHVAQLRAARRRLPRRREGAEGRGQRQAHRRHRLRLPRPPTPGRRPARRAAAAGTPDRPRRGPAAVRGRRGPVPAGAAQVRNLHDRRDAPALRTGRRPAAPAAD